jgi:hypothetical protein
MLPGRHWQQADLDGLDRPLDHPHDVGRLAGLEIDERRVERGGQVADRPG